MSRLEKTIERRSKKKKFSIIGKIVFIILLCINTMVCILIVDVNAKSMLGKDTQINEVLQISQLYIKETVENINKKAANIVDKFNK